MRKKNTKKELLESPVIDKKDYKKIIEQQQRETKSQTKSQTLINGNSTPDSDATWNQLDDFSGQTPKYASLLEITPAMMSRVTGYSETTCKQVLYGVYPNKDTAEFINQQMTIFFNRVKNVLYNVELWAAIEVAIESGKIRSAEQIRLFVELQNINQILNTNKYS